MNPLQTKAHPPWRSYIKCAGFAYPARASPQEFRLPKGPRRKRLCIAFRRADAYMSRLFPSRLKI